jgi:hypothetical protein
MLPACVPPEVPADSRASRVWRRVIEFKGTQKVVERHQRSSAMFPQLDQAAIHCYARDPCLEAQFAPKLTETSKGSAVGSLYGIFGIFFRAKNCIRGPQRRCVVLGK